MKIATAEDRDQVRPSSRLARPGHNCGRLARADRFGVVVDGADYFRALKHALLGAQRSILILGWEFDSRTALVRGEPTSCPNEIGALLDRLVRDRPDLRVHVLIWDSAMIYAFNREFAGLVKMDWLTHRRLRFKLDDSHPIASSQHQKIVVVDDALAFVGGLDVTSQRWDSRGHVPLDPHRRDPAFADYPPFHDVMAVVTGPVAGALAGIVRERWRRACGEVLTPPHVGNGRDLWPPWLPVPMRRVQVAISCTSPVWDGAAAVREVERLYLDMIAAARRFIYIENQYFASRRIAEALAERLMYPDCPEIVLINPGEPVSLVERSTMGVARSRLARDLALADGG
ncbi:MAG: phospholipase, partial [Magnetospirillum sp.]|nr:phospholipase [Magnetospirillum sp.]